MKYFTKEIWAGINGRGELTRQQAFELSERNADEYIQQLEQLKGRLSEDTYYFFRRDSLHDGRLLSFSCGDGVDHIINESNPFDINSKNTAVQMRVIGAELNSLYTLKYGQIKRALFDYPSDSPLFYGEGWQIGDWGYDELTAVNDQYLRHEILFSSGTIILIEFKMFSYVKENYGEVSSLTGA
jgi:hypothetical protein